MWILRIDNGEFVNSGIVLLSNSMGWKVELWELEGVVLGSDENAELEWRMWPFI